MTCLQHLRPLAFSLVMISVLFKVARCSGKLYIYLDNYQELSKNLSTKCIKLCVTSAPVKRFHCYLNSRTGNAKAMFRRGKKIAYPKPNKYDFYFSNWKENSEIEVKVWNLPQGQTCDSSSPVNKTIHGIGHVSIPRDEINRQLVIEDLDNKWRLSTATKIICATTDCLAPCTPRDDSTGHYTCKDNQKKCHPDWFGEDCKRFCNKTATNYRCLENGHRLCFPYWYGETCSNFCNNSATAYKCDDQGNKVCSHNWFGRNCMKYCNSSATTYKCNDQGNKVCLRNWHGGKCSKYCNNSATAYKCNDKGEKVCSRNWYGTNCSEYCNSSAATYKCNDQGKKVCLRNWHGDDCTRFCNNNATTYRCDHHGNRLCLRHWYGEECSIHCHKIETVPDLYLCKIDKGSSAVCPKYWKARNCSSSCIADKNTKKDLEYLFAQCGVEARLCSRYTTDIQDCSLKASQLKRHADNEKLDTEIMVGLFGTLLFIVIITVIIVVVISKKKKRSFNNNVCQLPSRSLVRELSQKDLILNIDELMRHHDPEYEELSYENVGMMVDNPLYDATKKLRATTTI